MASFRSFLAGFKIMVATIAVGTILSFVGGLAIDMIYSNMNEAGYFDPINGTDSKWTDLSTINYLINLFYFLCYLLPLLGFSAFFLNTIRKQEYDEIYPPIP